MLVVGECKDQFHASNGLRLEPAVGGGDEFAIRTHTTDGHGHRTSSSRVNWGVARPEVISLLIQLLNVLVVIIVAFKYVRKTAMVNVGFLIQSFVATTLGILIARVTRTFSVLCVGTAFAGMHVTIFLLDDAREAYWVPCKIAADSR